MRSVKGRLCEIRLRKVLARFSIYRRQKKEHFDIAFIRNFAPRHFDRFEFVPSMGALGGILVVWNSSCFVGQVVDKQQFGITITFSSTHNSNTWHLTSVYGPCTEPNRSEFINWFRSHNIADTDNWIFWGILTSTDRCRIVTDPGGIW